MLLASGCSCGNYLRYLMSRDRETAGMARARAFVQPIEPEVPFEEIGEETYAPGSDLSGWPSHPSERRDLYHRIRFFPPEVARWRKWFVEHVQQNPGRFPEAARKDADLTGLIDEGISYLREVARILAVLYRSPDLGNKPDPTDELVYIILARKTRESAYQQTFEILKRRFPGGMTSSKHPATRWNVSFTRAVFPARRPRASSGHWARFARRSGAARSNRPEAGQTWIWSFLCSLPEIHRKSTTAS